MKITRKDIMKAVLSVLTTMLFCGCLCYVTMRYFTTYDGDKGYLTHLSHNGEIPRNGREVIRARWHLSPRMTVSIMVYMIRIVGCSVPMMD